METMSTPTARVSGDESRRLRAKWGNGRCSTRGVAWRLFLTCWLVYALHVATNTVREI